MFTELFQPEHAARLEARFAQADWREALKTGAVRAAQQRLRVPPPTANVFSLPVEQLLAINGPYGRALIARGERDEERLLSVLGAWPDRWPDDLPVRLSFVGLNLTLACDMQPRCLYCNQRPVPQRLDIEAWRAIVQSLASSTDAGPYLYMTGGEPLLLGPALWGPDGLIHLAGEAGAACNVNTNALALSPQAALGLVASGTGRVHISLDTSRPEIGDAIHRHPGRWQQVLTGLYNLQIAKLLLGTRHPVIHLNCVLTRINANDFPEFVRFVLAMKPLPREGLSNDLDFHLIPVGGEGNQLLRLTASEYRRFFTETWAAAEDVWTQYCEALCVPADQRKTLVQQMPFMSPYHRVAQRGDLAAWAEQAAAGLPGALALTSRCYVAPTQAFVLPDGNQYWCGGHATSRPAPLGNVLERPIIENIRENVGQLRQYPNDFCRTCPGATLAINQTVEQRLREQIGLWLRPDAKTQSTILRPAPEIE